MFKLPTIWPVACHTDNVGPGSTFVAICGATFDGAHFIDQAIKKGTTRIVVQNDALLPESVLQLIAEHGVILDPVADTRLALAQLSAQAHNFAAEKLKLIGITGTKGKTTTAYLTHHLLQTAGFKVALLSTVENKIGEFCFKAPLTTAQPDYLHMFFDQCVKQGITHVVMEVAAQALSLHRVHGLQFDIGAFTNFAHEHLEFYDSMEEYFAAKYTLFDYLKADAPCLLNVDDEMVCNITYANSIPISLANVEIEQCAPHIVYTSTRGDGVTTLHAPSLMGTFNVYNVLFATHIVQNYRVSMEKVKEALLTFPGVSGRMEKHLLPNGATCYIDYAHTPDSYQHVLSLLCSLTNHLIVVFGCGGMRDKTKRPLMGSVAAHFADVVILTNDNPRNEDPKSIVEDILCGIDQENRCKVSVHLNRTHAIERAYAESKKDTIIAVLGKGPDAYQQIGDTRFAYSDMKVVNALK